jgi:hypothetical protein
MYNNTITNTDVKVPVEVSLQLGNHGKKTKETQTSSDIQNKKM